jgi:hypothetical protein
MKARTLRHLILLSGKSLAVDGVNSSLQADIYDVCETLHVERERQSPYILSYTIRGVEKSLLVDEGRFTFHVRGDVPSRLHLTQDRDIRKENWTSAMSVWEEILQIDELSKSSSIAPIHKQRVLNSPPVIVFRLLASALGLFAMYLSDSTTALAMTCLAGLVALPLVQTKANALRELLFSGLVLFGMFQSILTYGLVLFCLIELVVAILTNHKWRILTSLLGVVGTFIVQFNEGLPTFSSPTLFGWVAVLCWIVVALVMFPRGVASDLSRSSAPLAVALLAITHGVTGSTLLWGLVLGVVPLIANRPAANDAEVTTEYTPVTVRRK